MTGQERWICRLGIDPVEEELLTEKDEARIQEELKREQMSSSEDDEEKKQNQRTPSDNPSGGVGDSGPGTAAALLSNKESARIGGPTTTLQPSTNAIPSLLNIPN